MDETHMALNLSNTAVGHCDTKSVAILSTGHERANFTVVLACMANGEKLPSVIIFKLVNVPREDFPDVLVIVRINPMLRCGHLYDHWINKAIKVYTPLGKIKRPSYSLVAN
ncbi:unnamed protein product [Rhizophagus irregularis]|nr:unnamed protein product [Rhizophagus irregularis]